MELTSNLTNYVRGSLEELRHVRWPTRNQAVRLSIITIVFTFATAAAYGVVDFVLGQGVKALLLLA